MHWVVCYNLKAIVILKQEDAMRKEKARQAEGFLERRKNEPQKPREGSQDERRHEGNEKHGKR